MDLSVTVTLSIGVHVCLCALLQSHHNVYLVLSTYKTGCSSVHQWIQFGKYEILMFT